MKAHVKTIAQLMNDIRDGDLTLPDLQRDFVWGEKKIFSLVDSIMREYPVGSLLLWNTQYVEIRYRPFTIDYRRNIPLLTDLKEKGQKLRMVLDGQQRLQSLYVAFRGTHEGRHLYFDLLSGPKSKGADEDDDYQFSFWTDGDASRPKHLVRVATVVSATKAAGRKELERFLKSNSCDDDDTELAHENFEKLRSAPGTEVPLAVIDDGVDDDKSTSIEDILQIFTRVNTQGTALSGSDIRFSLMKTKWNEARENCYRLIESLRADAPEGLNNDFLLRGMLTVSDCPTALDVPASIEEHLPTVKECFPAFERALRATLELCRDPSLGIRSRGLLQPINALLPAVYYISRRTDCIVPESERANLRTFICFLLFNKFIKTTKPDARLRWLREVLQRAPGEGLPLNDLLAVIDKRQASSLVVTHDSLLARDPELALSVAQPPAEEAASAWRENEPLGHIFSASVLDATNSIWRSDVDDLGNRVYFGTHRVVTKKDAPPSDTFKNISDAALKQHLLIEDRALLAPDRFQEFIQKRRATIVARVAEVLGR